VAWEHAGLGQRDALQGTQPPTRRRHRPYRIGRVGRRRAGIVPRLPTSPPPPIRRGRLLSPAARRADHKRVDPSGRTFAYHVDNLRAPAWARQAVIYQSSSTASTDARPRQAANDRLMLLRWGRCWACATRWNKSPSWRDSLLAQPHMAQPVAHGNDGPTSSCVEPRLGGDEALHAVSRSGPRARHPRAARPRLQPQTRTGTRSSRPRGRSRTPTAPGSTFETSESCNRTVSGNPPMPPGQPRDPGARDWMIGTPAAGWRVSRRRLPAHYANGPGPDFRAISDGVQAGESGTVFCFGEWSTRPT